MFFSVLRMSYDESWNTICHKNGSNNGKSFNILIECNLNFCSISLIINKLMLSFVSNEDNWLTVMVLLQNFFLHYSHEGFEFSLFTTNSSIDDKCSRTKKICQSFVRFIQFLCTIIDKNIGRNSFSTLKNQILFNVVMNYRDQSCTYIWMPLIRLLINISFHSLFGG